MKKEDLLAYRHESITHLEKTMPDTKFIVYISSDIDYADAVGFYNVLRNIGHTKRICLIIDSPGGDPDAAYKIVRLLKHYCEELIAVVPFMAKSAATLITLGTDEIQMGPISELGPIDPQISMPQKGGHGAAQAIRDCIDYLSEKIRNDEDPKLMSMVLYPIIDKLDPWIIGRFERTVKAAAQYARALLANGMLNGSEQDVSIVVQRLSEGYFSHGYVIDRIEASEMGLNIKSIDDEYWDSIWDLYYSYHYEIRESGNPNFYYYIDTVEVIEGQMQIINDKEATICLNTEELPLEERPSELDE